MPLNTSAVLPIFRIFSIEKAREFYVDYLGFTVDWEHRYEENMPLYMIPDRFSWQPVLPKTSTDKVDYQRLKEMG